MIYDTHGTPLRAVYEKTMADLVEQRLKPRRATVAYLMHQTERGPQRVFNVVRDRLGDIMRVYRAVDIHRPGRRHLMVMAIKRAGSQRKAAKEMGIALSTLQRRLAHG